MKPGRRYSTVRIEWDYIHQLLNDIKDDKIRALAANQIMWHTVRTNRYRFYEHLLDAAILLTPTMTIVLNALVPGSAWWKQAFLIGVGTLTASAKAFSPFHDKRVLYRKCAENLRNEAALYVNRAGKYHTGEDTANEVFVKAITKIAKETNRSWGELEKTDNETQIEKTSPKPTSNTDSLPDESRLPEIIHTNQEEENGNV